MTSMAFLAARVEQGPLRWADLPPAWLLTVIVVVGFLWIRSIYAKERGRAGRWPRLGLALLRTLVLLLILLVLGGPYRQEERRAVEPSHLVVLIDSSASMKVWDKYEPAEERKLLEAAFPTGPRPSDLGNVSRAELVRRVVGPEGEGLLRKWAERFVLHVFAFDGDWRSLGSTQAKAGAAPDEPSDEDRVGPIGEAIRKLVADGGRTRLGAVLRNLANEFGRRQDQHLAGVVLISDGRDTSDGEPPQQVLATMGPVKEKLQVAAIGLGNPASGKNLWVERIRAKEVVLVRDNVIFETALRHTDFDDAGGVGVRLEISKIADEQGRRMTPRPYAIPPEAERGASTRIAQLRQGDEATPVRLQAPLNETGTYRVWMRAEFEEERDRILDSVPEDDARYVDILVKDQRIKVLYVDKLPRHDWRFLSNYLTREPGNLTKSRMAEARSRFEVHVLLQTADPAFRQPASLGLTPIRRFPSRREELFAYDVIIWGDVDWRRLDPADPEGGSRKILQLVADFVEEGGGLALQAGVDYHNPVDLRDTPMAALLPVNVRVQDKLASAEMSQEFRLRLTPAGELHPVFAVVPGSDGSVPTIKEIAQTWSGGTALSSEWTWYWLYRAEGGLRPGAIDLARVKLGPTDRGFRDQRGQPLVVFASMGYGKGQVFWSALDTLSRLRRAQRDRIYGAFWEQIIRYLATYRLLGGNRRFKIFTDKDSYFVGETAQVTITALDDKFQPLEDDFLDGVHIEMGDDPTTTESTLLEGDARPRSLREDGATGTYSLMLPLKKKGLVRIWIDRSTPGTARGDKERAERSFEVNFRAREDILKVPDHDTLRDIVAATNPGGGEPTVHKLHEVDAVVASMQARPRERVLDRRERTQWDKTWVLLLITALLGLEWLLRKRYQMI